MEVKELTAESARDSKSFVLAMGDFDGVHKGHRALLQFAKQFLENDDELSVLHISEEKGNPASLHKDLTPLDEQLDRLKDLGVTRFFYMSTSNTVKKELDKEDLLNGLAKHPIRNIVVGSTFNWKNVGLSSLEELTTFCQQERIHVTVARDTLANGRPIQVEQIRQFIEDGKMEAAQALLGRPYTISGIVIHGEKLGRQLGFPTANMGEVDAYVYPKPGVYLGSVGIHEEQGTDEYWNALISTGYRPTVNGNHYLIEAYLLDFSGDLYGKRMTVSFLRYMRGEIKFDGLDPLIEQMRQDEREAKTLLGMTSFQDS